MVCYLRQETAYNQASIGVGNYLDHNANAHEEDGDTQRPETTNNIGKNAANEELCDTCPNMVSIYAQQSSCPEHSYRSMPRG